MTGPGEVALLIEATATAVLRLLLAAGVAFFIVGVARGAFDGVLASAVGSPGGVSTGIARAAAAAGAFLFLLVSFGVSRSFVGLLADRFVSRGALSLPAPGAADIRLPTELSRVGGLVEVVGQGAQLTLFLIGGWFVIQILLALISGQIALATDAPGGLARLVERLVFSTIVLILAVAAPALARDLARAVLAAESLTTGAAVMQLYGVIFTMIIDILLAVFVATLVVASVGSGVVTQAGLALGSPGAAGRGVARLLTGFSIALLGFGGIVLANQLIARLFR